MIHSMAKPIGLPPAPTSPSPRCRSGSQQASSIAMLSITCRGSCQLPTSCILCIRATSWFTATLVAYAPCVPCLLDTLRLDSPLLHMGMILIGKSFVVCLQQTTITTACDRARESTRGCQPRCGVPESAWSPHPKKAASWRPPASTARYAKSIVPGVPACK